MELITRQQQPLSYEMTLSGNVAGKSLHVEILFIGYIMPIS
jgi:hypothetical protein